MKFLRLFKKNIPLRIVNFAGLSIMFACLLLSASYIKRELSFDKHYTHADRIVRMTFEIDGKIDGRSWGDLVDLLPQIPEIEKTVKMAKVETAVLTCQEKKMVVKDFYKVSSDFLQIFDFPLLQGDKENALNHSGQALLSESFARQLFGELDNDNYKNSVIFIEGRQVHDSVIVSGIFKDMPKTSHFTTDILVVLPENGQGLYYTYLLLKENTDIEALAQKITEFINENKIYEEQEEVRTLLMPLTDIHLHSHNLREMSVNGNIHYIYLLVGANALLLLVVLFNLWLNASLIFASNRRYYQFLRLYGMPPSKVFTNETLAALFLGTISIIAGVLITFYISSSGYLLLQISILETVALCLLFLFLVILVSLIPVLKHLSLTQFLNTHLDLKPVKFSYSNVKYMLMAQYAVVMLVVILAFGINKQMNLVKETQVGGNEQNILVMTEQPEAVKEKYETLKSELLKYKEIEAVTASFQIPGNAIRDHVLVKKEDETEGEYLPLMVSGEDFLPFFRIPLIAGEYFSPNKFDYQTELSIAYEFWMEGKNSENIEEYIVNQKALNELGFDTPEDAIGQILQIEHNSLGYFNKGIIVGVTDDFNYTGLYEETNPLLIMQRNMFLHCIMVRLNPDRFLEARNTFEKVWNEVNPDYPADYLFMNDLFSIIYRNEMNAQYLVFIFSLLCLIVADLGLIIFMAFIIRRRTKEIGLRKVHGASVGEIVQMLNMGFVRYVALAFVIATPVAWYVMHRWLQRFAYRTSLDWWIFALAGVSVLLVSALSVSLQSWRAARTNPVEAIKIS